MPLRPVGRWCSQTTRPGPWTTASSLGRALLEANPELQLHHLHDANQDYPGVRWDGATVRDRLPAT